jgi:FMN-dependent NADH-azoreductase
MRVLHIDASARSARSHTRRLASLYIEELRRSCPEATVIYRDLSASTPPHVTEAWIAAAFTRPEERTPAMEEALRISNELVDELLAADHYVFAVPMYNYSVPSAFKAYIDQIVRVGRTFSFDPEQAQPYAGLIRGKSMVLITARGDAGYGPGGPNWSKNHLEPYVAHVFGFLGVERIDTVAVENDEFGGRSLRDSVRAAEERVRELAGCQCCVGA